MPDTTANKPEEAALRTHIASLPRSAADDLIVRLLAAYPKGAAFLMQSVAAAAIDKAEKTRREASPIDLTNIASSPLAAAPAKSAPAKSTQAKVAAQVPEAGSEEDEEASDEEEDEDQSEEDEEESSDEELDVNGEMIPKEWMYEIDVKRPWLRVGGPKDAF